MNFLQSLFYQQLGLSKQKNYDVAIKRLACIPSDNFTRIYPEVIENELFTDPPVFACKFAQAKGFEHMLALANEEGKISICNTETPTVRFRANAHNNAIFDLSWIPNEMRFVTASGDHSAALFQVATTHIVFERLFRAHSRSLKSVACRLDDNKVFATGSRDGKIMIWDTRAPSSCNPDISLSWTHHIPLQVKRMRTKSGKLQNAVSGSSSVTSLIFQDYYNLISCGAGDGLIKVWDMRKTYYASNRAPLPKHSLPYAGTTFRKGFSNLIINSSRNILYANCMDNAIYCYNILTYSSKPVMKYVGHKNSTFYVKAALSPDGKYLLSGSSDNLAYIWDISKSTPKFNMYGHDAEVTCVAWSQDGKNTIVTCSDDLRHKIWRITHELTRINTGNDDNMTLPYTRNTESDNSIEPFDFVLDVKKPEASNEGSADKQAEKSQKSIDSMLNDIPNIWGSAEDNTSSDESILFLSPQSFKCDSNEEDDNIGIPCKRMKYDSGREDLAIETLPNFVEDGSAPHLITSPVKKKEVDWLTKMRMERLSSKIQELSAPSPSKLPKEETTNSQNNSSNTGSATFQTNILKYFKITNSTNSQSKTKSPNSPSDPASPKSESF